ncbi:hypothetical protein WBG99_16245 [Streptomyces sp. TG1A-60]|uniref:hypothetical protein n=1 Tax=Streptomyces sp. TG1A-60 TaxID=3129111 RepID=UPI0030D1292F
MSAAIDRQVTTVATSRARVSFDGRTVTVHRRLAPGLPWRPRATHLISHVLGAELVWLGGEGERRQFDVCLAGAPTVRIPVAIGQNPHRGQARRREEQWATFAGAINTASGQWMRRVLDATVGTGPWSEAVWRQAETLAPEVRVFMERDIHVPPLQGRKTRSHREMIEAEVLGPLRGDGVGVGAVPVRGVAWSGFRADKSPLHRVRAEAWLSLIGKLEPR